MIGLKRGIVKLSKPKASWKNSFEKEKIILKKIFGIDLIDIQHIGSTAISGILPKPVIDIGLIVPSLAKVKKHITELSRAGYTLIKEDREDRLFFIKGAEDIRTHYLHIGESGSDHVEDMILFRDYLNKNKRALEEYAKLKKELAKEYSKERYIYTEKKGKFIESIIKQAKYGKK